MNTAYKRNYHPFIILLFVNGMLPAEVLKQLPKTTKYNWNQFKHENYYGYQWAESYINEFDQIKDVFQSKFTARAIKTILKVRRSYYNMLGELVKNKNILKQQAQNIIHSIEHITQFSGITIKKACKFYGISKDWYYTQKQKIVCSSSLLKKCFKQFPNQLTFKEITTIEHLVKNNQKPLSSIYFEAMKNQHIACGLTAFRKYANLLGYKKAIAKPIKRKKGLQASYIFEWLHIDITHVQTINQGVQKVAFVKDNFSSALLHFKSTSGKAGSQFIAELLQETFKKYHLYQYSKGIHILSDGGPENKGEVLSWIKNIKAPPVIKKITALTEEFPFSNAMSESTHKIYKSEFMGGNHSENEETHLKSLENFMEYYNNNRFPCRLFGKTPMEIVNGQSIDKHLYSETLQQSKIQRVEANRNFNECRAKITCISRA